MWCKLERVSLVALVTMCGCAATRFEATWREPTARAGELSGRRVAAVVASDTEAMRRSGEDALAAALRSHGMVGIPGYTLVTADQAADDATLRRTLRSDKIDAVVRMRVVDTGRTISYSGAYPGPYWGLGYGYGWATAGYPGAYVDTVVRVETTVYSLADNTLLWAGISRTADPARVQALIADVAAQATGEMKKQGLVPR